MRFERFDTPGAVALQLALGSTDLDVTTWDQAATEIELEGRRSDEATTAAIDAFRIELHPRSGGHELVVREPKRSGFRLREPQITVRVRCPEGTALSVSGGSSDIRTDGVLGVVELKTGSGDVTLGGVVASGRLTAASGDVEIDAVDGALPGL